MSQSRRVPAQQLACTDRTESVTINTEHALAQAIEAALGAQASAAPRALVIDPRDEYPHLVESLAGDALIIGPTRTGPVPLILRWTRTQLEELQALHERHDVIVEQTGNTFHALLLPKPDHPH